MPSPISTESSGLAITERNGEFFVSSETVAAGAGVEHRAVLQLIDNNRVDFEDFGPLAFEMRKGQELPQGGFAKSTRVALLNEQQSTLLMTYQRNTEQVRQFKKALVKAFYEMARQVQPALPQDYASALRALADEAEQKALLEAKVEADAPKVEYIDTFVADEDLRIMRNVAKDLGIQEKTLRVTLIERKWIYAETTTRWSETKHEKEEVTRYSACADKRNYFRAVVNHDAPRFKGEVMHTLKVTPAGAAAIARQARIWGLVPRNLVAVS